MRIAPYLLAATLPSLSPAIAQSPYQAQIDRWKQQDQRNPPPRGGVVVVGSSSVRLWEHMSRDLAHYDTIQRGFGGSQFADLNQFVDELVLDYEPAAVVVFEGTNDVAAGKSAQTVFQDYLTFVDLVHAGLDRSLPPIPILFIGITPTPARWSLWPTASAVNAMVEAEAATDPALHYLDIPAPFLATGMPPSGALFLSDGLHLNEAGYDLWTSVIRPGLEAVLPPTKGLAPNPSHPRLGERILFDFGPQDVVNGNRTPGPDANGNHWNNWQDTAGGVSLFAGEHIGDLVTTGGIPSGIDIVLTGECSLNGLLNGGLLDPLAPLLGRLAIGTATQDYFFGDDGFLPFGFYLTGLDPACTYDLRFFGTRNTATSQVTTYRLVGAETLAGSLPTSGSGIGAGGYNGNNDTTLTFQRFAPDRFGQVFVDVRRAAGNFAYLGVLELTVRSRRPLPRAGDPTPR